MKFHTNNLILILGLIFQSFLIFGVKCDHVISWGLCVWMSIPYWILFFANLHSNHTMPAKITVTSAIYIIVLVSAVIYGAYDFKKDALNGLVYLFLPVLTTAISSLILTIAVFLNRYPKD